MAEYVDPINSKSFYDYNVALNEAGRKSAQAEIDAAKAKGVDLLNPEGGVLNDTTGNAIRLRSMLQGIANSDDQEGAARFYGLTPENYQNVLSGDMTRPMGANQAVYGAQLLSPLEQIAAETARGQGISTMSPKTLALAQANPDVFNTASQKFQNYLATTYPGTLEYESVLSGPMQFSDTGVKYPEIKDTVSMYILDPRTKQYVKNPNYRGAKKAADGGLMSLADSPRQSGLHQFADMVASKGRGEDSLLIHMTPDEVNRLQEFAKANGRSLTINPDTGLPEAGMLSDLFKAVAPIALGAFLGPGAFGIAGMGLSAGTAGLVTGGLTTLATGSLSRGLMAGLGAYGGAGLAQGFADAGVGAGMSEALAGSSSGNLGQAFGDVASVAGDGSSGQAFNEFLKSSANPATMSGTELAASGLKAAATDPLTFAKNNFGSLAAAAAPIMAGSMVPTTTKMPENTNPAYIRQKLYDPYTQTYKSLAPVKASEFGSRNFSDAYTNPQTGEMATLQPRAPSGFAGGGIVALASGGVSDADIFKYFQTPGLSDTQIAADMQKYGVSAADIARATGTQNQQADYEKRFVNTLVSPTTDSSEFLKATGGVGLQGQALTNAMQNAGLSQGAQYALTQGPTSDVGFTGGIIDASTGKPVDLYNQIGYTAGALPGDQAGLEGLYGNINYVTSGLQNLINTGKMSVADAQNAAIAELTRTKVGMGDVEAATGKKFGDLFKPKPVTKIDDKTTVTGGTGKDVITGTGTGTGINTGVIPGGFYGNNTGNPLTSTPGDITRNLDGTVTVQPNIPGRPTGGFPGMASVRNAYTAGGGSLGYTAPVPKTAAEHNALYNKQTDDSLDAYNFLMGKGKNLAQVNAARSRPLMQPYFTESNRYKPKFLSYDQDGKVVSSGTGGKPADVKAAELTKAKTIEVVDSSGYNTETYTAVLQEDGSYLAGNGKRYDVTGKQIAAGGGMMGYAMGGGLGSLGAYSDGGRLLKGPGDGVSDSIPATIGRNRQPARLADGEFVIPARIVSELGNGSTEAGAKKLYAMMDRVQKARGKTTGKNKVAANSRADKHLPA